MLRKFRSVIAFAALLLLVAGCGKNSEVKTQLQEIELTKELPAVMLVDCRSLADADNEVYRQQIAACEMYYEAYELTRTSSFIGYKKTAYYCNERRKELQLDIATQLNDNVYAVVRSVEDCNNISAYLERVIYDTVNFYDYYMDFINSDGDPSSCYRILTVFYEKSNILALRFLDEYKYDIIQGALQRIRSNAAMNEDINMYIAENNEIIKALNTVYGGVPSVYAEVITRDNLGLARKLLEENNKLSEEEIDELMYQLGEPTPSPEPTPTPEPTEEPTEQPPETPEPQAPPVTVYTTPAPTVRTQAPSRVPSVTPTPEIYVFGE